MTDKGLTFPRPDFGPVTVRQEGSQWVVDWHLSFACHNGFEALKLAAEIVAVEIRAHGEYEVAVSITRDPDVAEAVDDTTVTQDMLGCADDRETRS